MSLPTYFNLNIIRSPYINYTFCLNKINFLNAVVFSEIENDLSNIKMEITSSIGVFETSVYHIDLLKKGTSYELDKFNFVFNVQLLKNLSEKELDTVTVEVFSGEESLYKTSFNMEILPMDYFGGLQHYPQLLASYVLSNHPLVYQVQSEAVKILEKNHWSPTFEGYQRKDKERILQMVFAIYNTIRNYDLIYSSLPPSFEQSGQRIRLIDQVLETRFGNCIDISLVFAACLEAIDLHPIIVMTNGHAFVGLWLEDNQFDTTINWDQAAISKRIAHGIKDIVLIESTSLCKGSNLGFKDTIDQAETTLMSARDFILSIDVRSARTKGVLPIPYSKQVVNNMVDTSEMEEIKLKDDYEIGDIYDDLELSSTVGLTKQKIWERKLLDLSLRNSLLNIRFTKSMLQLVDLKVNLLEDSLSDGKSFTIQPLEDQDVLKKYNLYFPPLHPSEMIFKIADEQYRYNKLLTYYSSEDLDNILTNLYRVSRLAEEENGKSTLYLGIGLLKWYDPKNKDLPRLAPILLMPVELKRKSVNSKFTLVSREEETMLNITLVEFLRQEYKLNINSLESLPKDESGVDVQKVLAIIRNEILNLQGWDVLEQTVLGIFSFNKLILWQDISKYSDEIQKSFIVKSLIDGKLAQALESVDCDDDILETIPAELLTLPIATDNSQLNAVKSAHENKSFILHGPPGTGKSQTITNIIADALANDKKVLFVAAKKAALDVVHKRLDNIGLAPFCLELHSNKSKKSDVLAQFEKTLEVPKYATNVDFKQEAERLDGRKKQLSIFVNQLHQSFPIGWTLYDTISYLETNQVHIDGNYILLNDIRSLDVTTWNTWKDWIVPFSPISDKIGHPTIHPLRFVKITTHQFNNKQLLQNAIEQYTKWSSTTDQHITQYKLPKKDNNQTIALLQQVSATTIKPKLLDYYFNETELQLLKNWVTLQTRKQDAGANVGSSFNTDILRQDWSSVRMQWNQSKQTWFLPKWLQQRKVKKSLNAFAKNKISTAYEVDNILQQLEEFTQLQLQLQAPLYSNVQQLGILYSDGMTIHTAILEKEIGALQQLEKVAIESNINDRPIWIAAILNNQELRQRLSEMIQHFEVLQQSKQNLLQYLFEIPDNQSLQQILVRIDELENWINYNNFKSKANQIGLEWLIQLLEKGFVRPDNIAQELEKVVHINLFVKTVYGSEILNSFDATIYNSLIQQYKSLHSEFTTLTKNQLIVKLSNKVPNASQEAAQSSEIGTLQKAIKNKGRGLSIRKLFDQIPTLLPRLKPCMLMSPISVAQYFDVDTDHFDIVIFDEASQLPTAEAISALARAKQAIIVGDPKQMPPTSFFASTKTDEDNMELEDLESILDDCLALSIPSNYLLRHYRSKHESLISFSNYNFYDSKLLTFPSHDDLDKKVTFEFVQGFYDKGKTRTNRFEAAAIIQYIKQHLETKNNKSLGVVTFSQTQQSLIEDQLQKLFQENPTLEEAAIQTEDTIFIKNLENVQGDERDIILFSVGYGPDENGTVSMNFGPLNRDGGSRRLNVAVTRARYEMKVFSSLKSDQIDLNRTKSEGVRGLKNFLAFAEKGIILQQNNNVSSKNQTIIDTIAKYLSNNGLEVKTHIGTSDYRVDIGVLHPENKQDYILAILVDGDNYYRIHTTNDRELLAPNVLKSLGWNVFRIWTLDWMKHKDRIVQELKTTVDNLLQKGNTIEKAIETSIDNTPTKNHVLTTIEEPKTTINRGVSYKVATVIPLNGSNSETIYHDSNRNTLRNQMLEIISVEGPISQNWLFKKVLRLWNTARVSTKLSDHLTAILALSPAVIQTRTTQPFYWHEDLRPDAIQYYRNNEEEKRPIEDIAPEEIAIAVMDVMNVNLGIMDEELIRLVSKSFGFLKTGDKINTSINWAINDLVEKGKIKEDNGKTILL